MKCPKCGAPMENNSCDYCGYVQPTNATEANAGKQNPASTVITQVFVNTASSPAQAISPKSRWLALAICYFLGVFGGHYFYVGRAGKGLLYLCTGGLFCIGWVIDLISIATGNFTDGNNLPLKK